MKQDTIHHVVTPESPKVQVAEESQAEQYVKEGGIEHSSGDSLQESQQQIPFEEAFNPGISLWMQDSIATVQVDSAAKDSLPSLKTSFFSNSMFTAEQQAGRYGMAGDPMPYNIRTDNVLASVIIIATLILFLSIGRAMKFFTFQLKNFFRNMRQDSSLVREAASDTRNLVFITIYGIIVLSLVFFFYTKEYIGQTFITNSEYTLMAIFLGEMSAYIFGELALQESVNKIFFTKEECSQWSTTKLLLYSLGSIALTPLLLLIAFFGLQPENAIIYAFTVVLFVKLLSFYKAFSIFFRKIGNFLQFFLYLCTLEIIPTLIAMGIFLLTANYLKVNY